MIKKRIALLLAGCLLLTGCDLPDSLKNLIPLESTTSTSSITSTSSSATSSAVSSKPAVPVATINCKEHGILADVTGVKYTSSPDSVTMQFTVGKLFTIQETIQFKTEEPKTESDKETLVVSYTDTITLGTLKSVNECLQYLDSTRFAGVDIVNQRDKYVAELDIPNLLRKAPVTSYTDCKGYCERLYKELLDELEANQAIVDGATGIIYHTMGGNQFTLTDYRLQVPRGGSVQIEIQNLPEGFTPEDVTFHSDRVGYASVSGNGTVTGNRNGSANITVSLKGAAVYCTVYVQVF